MIKININNSYIREAFQHAYNALYEPSQRQYDFINDTEIHNYWANRVSEILCEENEFTIELDDSLYPAELCFTDESDLIIFKLKHS